MLSFSANSFYRSFHLDLSIDSADLLFSPVYRIHNRFIPVHKAFEIKVKPDYIMAELKNKMFLAFNSGDSKVNYGFLSAKWDGDYLIAKSRTFGNYTIRIDTIMPEISPVNITEGKDISGQQTIMVKVWDTETGIRYFRGTLNGEWILMEYDPKKRLLTYNYDHRLQKGKNQFELVVEDMLRNRKTFAATLFY
jgi:hypothetical protein